MNSPAVAPRFAAGLIAGILLCGAPLAQEFDRAAAANSAVGLWDEDGLLCGGGPDYRVEFPHGRVRFVPALAQAPRTMPLALTLQAIARGSLHIAAGGFAAPHRHGHVVDYARRGGVIERYELGVAGIEQSFILPQRPRGRGAVIVRLAIDTEMVCEREGDVSDGLTFHAGEFGGVTIGRATAIDARGARFAMSMRRSGSTLELVLDDAAVENADYPLVLDPPINRHFTISGFDGDSDPHIAWDEGAQRYLAVWSRRLSVSDVEVRGHLLTPSGSRVGSLLALATGTVALNPVVAVVTPARRFLVVWQQADIALGPFALHGTLVDAVSGGQTTAQPISGGGQNTEPDLCGSTSTGRALLVWHREGQGIRLARIDVPTAGAFTVVGNTSRGISTSSLARYPKISKLTGTAGRALVVWEEVESTSSAIRASLVDRNSAVLARDHLVASGSLLSGTVGVPDLDGDGTEFVVAYERTIFRRPATHDIGCRVVRWNGNALVNGQSGSVGSGSTKSIRPSIGLLGHKYLVAWAEERPGFLSYDVHAKAVSPTCESCGQEFTLRVASGTFDTDPVVAPRRAGGGQGDAMVVFSEVANQTLRTAVVARRFGEFGGGAVSSVGSGCGSGGRASADGPFAVGNVDFGLRLDRADANASAAVLFVGLPNATIPCGGCTLVDPNFTIPASITGGAARAPLPLPCEFRDFLQATLVVQWVTLGTNSNQCPLLAGLSASDRLSVTLDY